MIKNNMKIFSVKSVPVTAWSSKKPLNFFPEPLTTFLISLAWLLLWIPFRQKAGIGTILNVIIIAAVIEWSLPYLPHPEEFFLQIFQAIIGTLMVGLSSGLYLTSNLGPGPRDGLMTGFQRVSGLPIALVRVFLEISVITVGWLLGGSIGVATVIFAFGVGPSVSMGLYFFQFFQKNTKD